MGTPPQGSVRKLRELIRSIMELLGVAEYRRRARAWEPILLLPNFYVAARCNSISLRHNVKTFVQIVDAASLKAGRPIWVEKTPDHLFYVKRIQQYIPDAAFIHIIRNGRDTVASLVDAARKFPDVWEGPTPSGKVFNIGEIPSIIWSAMKSLFRIRVKSLRDCAVS